MKKKNIKSPKWLEFEKKVGQILTLSGYQVEYDCLIGSGQTDIFATNDVGPILTRVLVECKFSDVGKAVSINDVENFSSRVIVLRNQDLIDAGILVTNTHFTRFAKALIKNSYLELVTIEDLHLKIFDFRSFLRSFIDNFEKTKLNEVYIMPKMASLGLDKDLTIEPEYIEYGAPKSKSDVIEMTQFINSWVGSKGGGRLCILGDYGAGKTSFCQTFAFQQAKKHLKDPKKHPIPLLIPLHRYTKAINIKALITDFMVNDCRIKNFRYDSFSFLLKSGHFMLLLDGFDEMARHVDKEVRYQTISELSKLARGDAKVILTGRPGYFPTHDELMQIIVGSEEGNLYQIARDAYNELVDYEAFEIQPFNLPQISKYVNSYINNKHEASKILSYIKNTYNLLDLATRPVLLEMVVKSLPKLLTLKKRAVVNAAKLYDVYTNLWIDREEKKGDFRKLIRKSDKLRFMEELSLQLFSEDKNAVTYKQLNPSICSYFGVDDCELDHFAHDIRTCSFLFRVPRQGYMFIHRSFQEFFIAKKLSTDLSRKDKSSWGIRPLSKEIVRFLSELLIDIKEEGPEVLTEWAIEDPSSTISQNALLIFLLTEAEVPEKIKRCYGMAGDILQSYASIKLFDHAKTEGFMTYLYEDLFNCNRRAKLLNIKEGVDGLDIVHDAFYRTLNFLKREPLMTSERIRIFYYNSLKNAQSDVEKSILRQKRKEVSFSDLISDLSFQGYEIDEESIFALKPLIDEQITYKELSKIIERLISSEELDMLKDYYVDGFSIIELSKRYNISRDAIRSRLFRLRKKVAANLKEHIVDFS